MNLRKHAWLDHARSWFVGIGFAVLLLVLIVLEIRGCSGDAATARRIVEDAGYHDVKIGGPKRLSCGGDDLASNTFTATSTTGRTVHGVVCCGLLWKNCTMRVR
jgi:hypothetical protein